MSDKPGLGFTKAERIAHSNDFSSAFSKGQWGVHRVVRVVVAKNERPHSRYGFAVSKRFGNAVRRNLIKRRMREAIRQIKHDLPTGYDCVLLPSKFTPCPEYRDMLDVLPGLITKTIKRLAKRRQPRPKAE